MALAGPPRSYEKELPPRLFSHQCVEILRKLKRNNLCSLVTISRHRCGQRGVSLCRTPRVASPRCPYPSSTPDACYRELRRIPLPRTPVSKGARRTGCTLARL